MITIDKPENRKINTRGRPGAKYRFNLERRGDGQLWTRLDGKELAVKFAPCLPLTYPKKYISVQDDRDNEVAMIHDLSDLNCQDRELVSDELVRQAGITEIVAITKLVRREEICEWEVETKSGIRKFQTRAAEPPAMLSGGGLMIRSTTGELLYADNPRELDNQSRYFLAMIRREMYH